MRRGTVTEPATGERPSAGSEKAVALPPLGRRLVGGGLWALAGKATLLVMGLVTSALLTRLLPPTAVGVYFLVVTVVTISAMVARLGLEKSVLQLVAESLGRQAPGKARAVVRRTFLLATVGGVAVAGLYWGGLGSWVAAAIFHSPSMGRATVLSAVWILLLTFQVLVGETFRGFHDIKRATLYGGTITAVLTGLFLAAAWLWRGSADLTLAILLSLAATLLSAVWGGGSLLRRVRSVGAAGGAVPAWREVIIGAAPLLVSNLTLYVLARAGLWIVGAYLSEGDVALYGAASRVALLVSTSLVIAAQVLPPVIGELWVKGEHARLQRVLRFAAGAATLPSIAMVVVCMLMGGPILGLIFGRFYGAGAGVLAVLAAAQLVNVWVGACGYTLIMSGRQRELMWGSVAAAAIAVGGGLLAVGRFGIIGVAWATAVAIAAQQVYMLVAARLLCGVWTHARFRGLSRTMVELLCSMQ